jgi:hypothetical protein
MTDPNNIAQWGQQTDIRAALLAAAGGQPKRVPLVNLTGRDWKPEETLDFTLGVSFSGSWTPTAVPTVPLTLVVEYGNGGALHTLRQSLPYFGQRLHVVGAKVRAFLEVEGGQAAVVPTGTSVVSDIGKGRPAPWEYTQFQAADGAGVANFTIPTFAERFVAYRLVPGGTLTQAYVDALLLNNAGLGAIVPAAMQTPDGVPLPGLMHTVRITVGAGEACGVTWRGSR